MTNKNNKNHNEKFSKIKDLILAKDNFLITAHYSPDGDNLGSSFSIYELLTNLGKKAVIINEDPMPEKFHFLSDINNTGNKIPFYTHDEFQNLTSDKFSSNGDKKFENIIVLDVGSYERIGNVTDFFTTENPSILNLDHHHSNPGFGILSIVDESYASTTQLLFDFFESNSKTKGFEITESIASFLYIGILTDTGGFRYSNTNKNLLSAAAKLTTYGIDPAKLMEKAFYVHSYADIKKVGIILNNIEMLNPAPIAYLFHDQFKDPISDNDIVIDFLNSIEEAEITIFARKTGENFFKLSFRSKSDFDVSKYVSQFGGGGHPKAAGLRFRGNYEAMYKKIIKNLTEGYNW